MEKSFGYPLPVLLLLTLTLFTIVNSKSIEQQLQQQGATVSESSPSNSTISPFQRLPTPPDTSLELDSSEDDTGDEEEDGEDDEDDNGEEEEGEEEDSEDEEEIEDDASIPDDKEYENELRAVATAVTSQKSTTKLSQTSSDGQLEPHAGTESTDKEVSELLEYKSRKKKAMIIENGDSSVDKRVPTVKKELSTQKEILIADNETQLQPNQPLHVEVLDRTVDVPKDYMKNELQESENYDENEPSMNEFSYENPYTVIRPADLLKRLSKRQNVLMEDLRAYLVDAARKEKLQDTGSEEGVLAESLLKLFAKLAENPQRWNRVHQLLTDIKADLDYSRQAVEAQKRLVQMSNPFIREATSTLTTSVSSTDRPTKRPKKKKKKKKKLRQHHKPLSATTTSTTTESTTKATTSPPTALTIGTTESPWSMTMRTPAAAKWKLVAERLFGSPWNKDDDDSNVAKVRYSMPSKPRTLHRQLDENDQRASLDALNSERQALMLKAAREYSQPRVLHFGKINTHQQTSSDEDLDDAYESSERAYNRAHFGQLVPSSTSRLTNGYIRPRERPLYPDQMSPQSPPHFDVDFARNQEYLPPGREFAASKPWQAGRIWHDTWKWRQASQPSQTPIKHGWLPWHTERDYFARLEEEEEETAKAWQQAQQRQQQQNWNRQNLRDNLPPWLEEKEVHRVLQTPDSWSKSDKSRDYRIHNEENTGNWDNNRNNNSELKNNDQSKTEDDSKEAPKLTMKTWNSLTSDPATWPFKLPGAKPWPKDENGKSYNPNAELARKLGLYKNGRLRPDKDALKDLKQQKLQKSEKQGEVVPAEDTRTISWNNKVSPMASKVNSWIEPDEQQSTWFNKWKQFAYHKVTAQPTSKSGMSVNDKPNGKNAYIAVSAVSAPHYGNDWRKNDIEEIGQIGSESVPEDPDHPSSQMRMNLWKKSSGVNETGSSNNAAREDVLENQLENLKEGPVLLEVNVSIKNSTSHETSTPSPSTPQTVTEESKVTENESAKSSNKN